MNELAVRPIDMDDNDRSLSALAEKLVSEEEGGRIAAAGWPEYPYVPDTAFWIGLAGGEIILHYRVNERAAGVGYTKTNDPVCEDSCVEFFVSDGGSCYYNFEFNAIGTVFAGRGSCRKDLSTLPDLFAAAVRVESSQGREPFSFPDTETEWTLTAGIPLEIFGGTELHNPVGKTFGANFYKCAETTGAPHFVSWNPVNTPSPDFHRPEYFGLIRFL